MNYTTLEVAALLRDNPDTTVLDVTQSLLRVLPNLPNNLRCVQLRQLPNLQRIPELPEGLLELIVDAALTEIPALPKTLQRLCITGCKQLLKVPSLPDGLRTGSVVACPRVDGMPAIPDSIEYFIVLASDKLLASAEIEGFVVVEGKGALYQGGK